MQKIAIIDIGSNSSRLVITQIYKSGAYNMIYNQKEALRLSSKTTPDGLLTEEAFNDTLECMKSFATMCNLFNVDQTIAVATAATRNATNGPQLAQLIKKETGITVHVISGETEAYISYLGVINTLDVKDGLIFDLGGGSTELILFKDRTIVESVSLPVGCVNITNMFNTKNQMPPTAYSDISYFIMNKLGQYSWLKNSSLPLIGVGGTIRNLSKIEQKKIKYPSSKLHNFTFSSQAFRNIFKTLLATTFDQRKKIPGLSAERADVILAGSAIIQCLLEVTNSKKIITSGCGLREGLFLNYLAKTNNTPLIKENILDDSTNNMLLLYAPDMKHALHVTELALTMFDEWQNLHKLQPVWRKLLKTAAMLHDIGITINYYSHARHSAYMLESAKLFGLSHKEQVMASVIAGWHHGISRSYFRNKFFKDFLTDDDMSKISKMALLLSLAENLDYSQTAQISAIKPSVIDKKTALLQLFAENTPTMELHKTQENLRWFAKTFNMELKLETIKSEPNSAS